MTTLGSKALKLIPDHWYGWQMLPGYAGPYYSPIKLDRFAKPEDDDGTCEIAFFNACYARGVQSFTLKLRNVLWTDDFLAGAINYGDDKFERLGIVTAISARWIQMFCPELAHEIPDLEQLRSKKELFDRLEDVPWY